MTRKTLRLVALMLVTLFVGDTLWNLAEAVVNMAAR